MDLDDHSWLPLSGQSNWYLFGPSAGMLALGRFRRFCRWRLKTRLLLFFLPEKHVAHIISSPTRLKTRRPSGAGSGDILLRHTGMKLQRLCVCLVPTKCASVCVRACVCAPALLFVSGPRADRNRVGNYSGTNLMKTLFIWCYSLSYQSLTGYQGGWWIVFPSERRRGRGREEEGGRLLAFRSCRPQYRRAARSSGGQFELIFHSSSRGDKWVIN